MGPFSATIAIVTAAATPGGEVVSLSLMSASVVIAPPGADPFLIPAQLNVPAWDDPLLEGVRLRRPTVAFAMPLRFAASPTSNDIVVTAGPRPIAPRIDPDLLRPTDRPPLPRALFPGSEAVGKLPPRLRGGGPLESRVVFRLTEEGGRVGFAGLVAGALWKVLPTLRD